MSNSEPLAEGTVIMADEQFAGRGQQLNVWQSAPGLNLTFSIYLRPIFLNAQQQFYLNMCLCLGIKSALKSHLDLDIQVKWPNDLYFENKKLGGILTENVLQGSSFKQSIVGIGINVNQQHFSENISNNVISLKHILQRDVPLEPLFHDLCKGIEAYYLQLRNGGFAVVKSQYMLGLYKYNVLSWYRQNDRVFEAKIIEVQENGVLLLKIEDSIEAFNFKEIEFITH